MHEHEQAHCQSDSPLDLPACCGTGCAVCVLENVADAASVTERAAQPVSYPAQERAQCCHTGCVICVRDYPELVLPAEPDAQLLQLLEAIETAQQA